MLPTGPGHGPPDSRGGQSVAESDTGRLVRLIQSLCDRMDRIEGNISKQPSPPGPSSGNSSLVNTLLVRVEEMITRMDKIERSIASGFAAIPPVPVLPSKPLPSFASAASAGGGKAPHFAANLPKIPPNSFVNQFKMGHAIIDEMGGETVTVKAVLLFPSGDLKVFTKTRRMAQWLVDNKHAWTAKADSTFVTAQVSYPIRWLVSPKSAGKSQGSLLAHFFDKDLATKVQVAKNNHSSDHEALVSHLDLLVERDGEGRSRGLPVGKIDATALLAGFRERFRDEKSSTLPPSPEDLDRRVQLISSALYDSYTAQGTVTWRGKARSKSWWNPSILNPIVASRNKARQWLRRTGSPEARHCYLAWQAFFKSKVEEVKTAHWRAFLAKTGDSSAFQAYKFTKARTSATVEPLYNSERTLTTEVTDQAGILFKGTYKSVAIFSGNQGALLRINNPSAASSGQNLAMVANRTLRGLGLPAAVAKSTATSPLNPLTLPNSIAKLNQDSRATFSKEVALTPKEQIRFGFRTNPKKITQALDALEKGVAATIFQLRADQAPLNHFLMRIRTTTDPRCRFCGEIENAAHFLRFCRKYTAQRQALRKRLRQEKIRVSTHTSKAILDQPRAFPALGDYILATNRFPHIKLYRIPDTTLDTT
ncbi:hypothetical protein H4Q26_016408 [Puccinia striiformis f. sp. tritici PST-130]|nr:hypothetical protein H4Q26_016408 [Puccinia striiformis f. sp. tritici PST-130]